jgi:putative DNA primase/helicase
MLQPRNARPFVVSNGHGHENGAAGAAWPAPVPLVGQIERVAYPLDALPAAIRGAVEEVHEAVQASPEMVASSALAVVSLAVQSLADVSRSRTLPGPCSLYFLTAAESGDRKSTVDRLLGQAVRAFQDQQREASRLTLAAHTADIEAWEARRGAASDRMAADAKKDGKSIDGHRADLAQIEGEKPQPPRVPRLTYEDVTSEKLGKSLATEWPSGGIFSSEGGAVLGGHSMGKDAIGRTLALLNKLWDGADHFVDRATAPSFAVRGARMTISLQVQPHVLADFLDRDRGMSRGSGFLARFLVSQPMSLQGTRLYKESGDMPELGRFSSRITELLSDLPQVDPERGLLLPLLDFTADAKALWVESYNAIERELSSGGDFASIKDAASKAADNIARLAAVLHVFEYGARGPIEVQSVEAARRIVLWHAYSARALFAPFTLSREAANAATLDRWLIDRCSMEGVDGFSARTLANAGPNGTRKREDLDAALEILAAHGRVRVVQLGKRRTVKVNPALLDGTAEAMSDDDAPEITPRAAAPAIWNG